MSIAVRPSIGGCADRGRSSPGGPSNSKATPRSIPTICSARTRLYDRGRSGIKAHENETFDHVNQQLAALGLRFADPDEERKFRAEHAASVLTRQRVLIGFALVVFLAYAVRDIAIGPTFGYGALYLRIFFILPILGLSFVLTYAESVRPHFQTVFVALLVIVIAAIGMLSLLYPHYGPTDPAQANRTMSTMMLTLAIMTVAGLRFEYAITV